ncbi:beta-ketoacyl synthase N-terminal-like domain-containing protein [Actinoplanes sp. NEAU-A12]|uniref:Beta-ketoacyl synthase N-terminal-like domain-containing protein n=1 Tax=Actinoplanes sandaracinus TaxID=3045177 RepID=A0ABT6WHR3_9ACTN|nr:beta-ketoacyl synthase N-terminal-like domain-containing protein [Actinoplanes sandaracinus]MDI6099264.1 beta-ketoacyl synthase N-terminal-like domain-containing protein [Actinoplanes sandaracinus]
MDIAITGSAMRTALGGTADTYAALLAGRSGIRPLAFVDQGQVNVRYGYHIGPVDEEGERRASDWLTACVAEAAVQAGLDCSRQRVVAIVGTGLREMRGVERWHAEKRTTVPATLHFGAAVRAALPGIDEVITVSNACSASSHALALACDLIDLGDADAVVACGADAMAESMLAMIGRVGDGYSEAVRPFDADRQGVLLGDGAVAVVVQRAGSSTRSELRVRGVGLSCDAHHVTAPHPPGLLAAMRDAYQRAGLIPADAGLVVAHGTGTALNDPTEAAVLTGLFGDRPAGPRVTGIKGAIGHTSGSAGLMSLLVAGEALRHGRVPPIVGLRKPIPEAEPLDLVIDRPAPTGATLAQVNAFGFGGVNAVCLLEVTS